MARYLGIVVHLVGAAHLTFAAINHFVNYIPADVFPIDSAFSGKLKYLTFWNECIEAGFFCASLIDDVLQIRSDSGKSRLRSILDYLFTTLVFPVSLIVGTAFWGLYLFNRELVLPKVLDPYFPTWLNHSVHTFIVVYSILEMVTTYHPLPQLYKGLCGLWTLNSVYIVWLHVVYYKTEMWVYPIFSQLTVPQRILFLFGNFVCVTIFFFTGRYVNTAIWKKRIEKSTLQIN